MQNKIDIPNTTITLEIVDKVITVTNETFSLKKSEWENIKIGDVYEVRDD